MSGAVKSRRRALNEAYRLWPEAREGCAYCGVVADTYDHVPPLSMVHAMGVGQFEGRMWRVPACRECNSLLGSAPLVTVAKRREFVKKRLRVRYAKVLRLPSWSDAEIEGLGRGLQDVILEGASIREWVRRRLAW